MNERMYFLFEYLEVRLTTDEHFYMTEGNCLENDNEYVITNNKECFVIPKASILFIFMKRKVEQCQK